jgi:hypothetical protein
MSKDARITALAIMKSMLESGNYRVPDDEFQSTLQGFVQMIDRVAGPAAENSGGYSSQNEKPETPGGTQPHARPSNGRGDVHDFRVIAVEDKGTRISLQVEVGSETKWVSAWDQAKVEARGLQPGSRFRAKMTTSKCGKFFNVKNIVPDIPF